MDDDDRESNASSDNEHENDQDEVMEDADDAEGDNEAEEEDNDEEQDDADRDDGDDTQDQQDKRDDTVEDPKDGSISNSQDARESSSSPKGKSPQPPYGLFPTVRPEALTAKLYDIVPTMAAPQATSINAIAITPDLRYWMTGGVDGYIRKYDGPGTINGKQLLTVAQRHPFVDSVTKAGILMSYWENEEPGPPNPRGNEEHVLSPVYSLAIHSQGLWLLSGLDSGGINLQSVRHDEGKRITCLQQHSNAVSVLTLAQDEKSVLSGSWDKNIFDWDLNTGQTKRSFDGTGGQISAIELRPANGSPIPADAADEYIKSETISASNGRPIPNGVFSNGATVSNGVAPVHAAAGGEAAEPQASPAHESLFGGSDTGSLFGETVGGGFGGEDDDEFSRAMEMTLHEGSAQDGGMDHSADMAMANSFNPETASAPAVQSVPNSSPLMSRGQLPAAAAASAMKRTPSTNGAPLTSKIEEPDTILPPAPSSSPPAELAAPRSPSLLYSTEPVTHEHDPGKSSDTVFFSAAMDGTIRIWDRRVQNPVARLGNRPGVPPWCMGACWSPDGNWIYAGRRNGTVEEFNIHKARSGWTPERVLKFPAGSGAVSAVRAMPNGRHLVCASHDILRLYDLRDTRAFKHSTVPFLIIPGPPRAGVISSLYIDRTCRFMISAAGTRGWEGSCTEVLIGYEIGVVGDK